MSEENTMEVDENTKYKDGVNRNARLMVRNISFKATEESLRKHFEQYGAVEECKLLKRPDGKLVGCGFVHFTHVPMANKALNATNKKEFLGRQINVSWAMTKEKYLKKMEEKGLKRPAESCGAAENKSDDKKITEQESKEDKNKTRINRAARLIVRNISFKATEETLKEHFDPYGEVQEVKLLKKPDGKLVGCAFVHFKNVPMAKKALISTNMKPFLGRPVSVDWAVAKDKYMRHVVAEQTEMAERVKLEDADSDEDGSPPQGQDGVDVKQEIKSESESEDNSDDEASDKDDGDEDDEDDDEKASGDDDEEDDDEVDEDLEEDQSVSGAPPEHERVQLNDAEDGRTAFVTDVPFAADGAALRRVAERCGAVRYAMICVDKLTEHSKGSGFVKFEHPEDLDKFLASPPEQRSLDGQTLTVRPALRRDSLRTEKRAPRDSRHLYLVKEGVVVAGTRAAGGVSASDMAKRLALERSKTQMLRNLNRFVSLYRLVVSNLPPNYDDGRLRRLCAGGGGGGGAGGAGPVVTEARVMRDLRAPVGRDGKHPSKGYGFVMFTRHEDALACLRRLNNNPDIFDKNNRPIVSFSIEDRTALNARKKRLEKSIANNPLANQTSDNGEHTKHGNRKRKNKQQQNRPDDTRPKKRGKFEKRKGAKQDGGGAGKSQLPSENYTEYSGLTAKEGSQHKMRSNQKLRTQAEVHRQTVKNEKKLSKHATKLKMAAKERVKQPKQKINKKQPKRSFNEKTVAQAVKTSNNFSDMVSKYKSKLVGNSLDRVKSKWYET